MKPNGFIYLFIAFVFCLSMVIVFILGFNFGISLKIEEYETEILPALSVIGVWFGAIATCGAVIVSLWLAFKQLSQDKEVLKCTLCMMVSPGFQDQAVIGLTIVSVGNKPANIHSIIWYCKHAETLMFVTEFHQMSGVLPVVLSYGERTTIMHIEGFEKQLGNYINQQADGKFKDLYLSVNTTTTRINVKVDDGTLLKIKDSV